MVSSRVFLFVKHKPAYELRLSDWSSDVCSSVLPVIAAATLPATGGLVGAFAASPDLLRLLGCIAVALLAGWAATTSALRSGTGPALALAGDFAGWAVAASAFRSEEHTSELQSLMRISYAVFCLQKKNKEHT